VTKGGFFHHFPSKQALGLALVERYPAFDVQALEDFMAAAEAETDDTYGHVIAELREAPRKSATEVIQAARRKDPKTPRMSSRRTSRTC
jgi:AcrR family transcriptional regulator